MIIVYEWKDSFLDDVRYELNVVNWLVVMVNEIRLFVVSLRFILVDEYKFDGDWYDLYWFWMGYVND